MSYEDDKAKADAIYRQLMWEANTIVALARAPRPTAVPVSWWRRLWERIAGRVEAE